MKLDVFEEEDLNVSFYEKKHFDAMLQECRIAFIEVLYYPKEYVLKEAYRPKLYLDYDVLKTASTWAASNKFSAAKRRLAEGKEYKCKKVNFLNSKCKI